MDTKRSENGFRLFQTSSKQYSSLKPGLHNYPKQCFPKYLQSLQKQVNPKPILFPQYSCTRSCKQALKSYGYKATETIRRTEKDPNTPEGQSILHKRAES